MLDMRGKYDTPYHSSNRRCTTIPPWGSAKKNTVLARHVDRGMIELCLVQSFELTLPGRVVAVTPSVTPNTASVD